MAPVAVGMNVIGFWYRDETDQHGTPYDCARKLRCLAEAGRLADGVELFLMPSRVESDDPFEEWFYDLYGSLSYRTVHIGEPDPEFLLREGASERLARIARLMGRLESDRLILHAHHLRRGRAEAVAVLQEALPGITVLIENNGFDNRWGHGVDGLLEIIADYPECRICLDICHIKDFPEGRLSDYLGEPEIAERIGQIHYAFSPRLLDCDIYEAAGYPAYGPYHALWSIAGRVPSDRTLDSVRQYPVIIEGVVPKEDQEMATLEEEIGIIRGTRNSSLCRIL